MRPVIVGSGIAGLTAALRAAAHTEVVLLTKGVLVSGNTVAAQGGIAAAALPGDSPEAHLADTLRAGAGRSDAEAARVLCAEGPERIADLIAAGVAFDREGPALAGGLEAAHSFPRILHAGGDATGAHLSQALAARVREHPRIEVREHTLVSGLLTGPEGVRGVRWHHDDADGDLVSDAVVLATGGAGQLYAHTSNPTAATGDGLACALRAGAATTDLEFVQFHPTTLVPGNFLISEAVRGEGAVLRDAGGERFMLGEHPDAELAPRDVVARAVAARMAAQGGIPVRLDATAMADRLERRFPQIHAAVLAAGYDWRSEPIPITPAAHYVMGGVRTDLWGRTSVPGLYAVGEVACTGVHGANRLASNSLLEGAVFGHRAATALAGDVGPWPHAHDDATHALQTSGSGGSAGGGAAGGADAGFSRSALQDLMWHHVGLVRSGPGLREAARVLAGWRAPQPRTVAEHEDANLLLIARQTTAAALANTSSVGAHHRTDAHDPRTDLVATS